MGSPLFRTGLQKAWLNPIREEDSQEEGEEEEEEKREKGDGKEVFGKDGLQAVGNGWREAFRGWNFEMIDHLKLKEVN